MVDIHLNKAHILILWHIFYSHPISEKMSVCVHVCPKKIVHCEVKVNLF